MQSARFKHLEECCLSLLSKLLKAVASGDESSSLMSSRKRSSSGSSQSHVILEDVVEWSHRYFNSICYHFGGMCYLAFLHSYFPFQPVGCPAKTEELKSATRQPITAKK